MAISTSYGAPDLTSFATFSGFFKSLSDLLVASAYWIQANDTGQAVWTATSVSISAVAVSGSNATYTYDNTTRTGPALRIGMSVTTTGFTNGANNVTATITALGGSGASSTFTVTKVTQANETHAATGATTQSTLPGSNASIYEIWQPNDGLTTFYIRFDYTNNAGTGLRLKIQIGTATNGAGTLSGVTNTQQIGAAITTQTTPVESNFSVGQGYISLFLARTNGSGTSDGYIVDRTRNTDGTPSGDGVTQWTGANNGGTQQTIVFATGNTSPVYTTIVSVAQTAATRNTSTDPLNGQTPVFPVHPVYGKVGNPTPGFVFINGSDFADGCTFQTTLYGQTMTFLVNKNLTWGSALGGGAIRWD